MLESSGAREKTGSKRTNAILFAIVIHVVLGVIFALVVILPAIREEPEIIAEVIAPGPRIDQQMQKRSVTKQVEKAAAPSAASPIARLMRANTTAVIAAPEVKKVSDGPIGLGEGDFGDGGFGAGSGGFGSGASFFGAKSAAKRVVFVLDTSLSMSGAQREMILQEMEKTLKAFDSRIQYQVIHFSGPVWFSGWDVGGPNNSQTVKGPEGKSFVYSGQGATNVKLQGNDLPTAEWLYANQENVKRTVAELRSVRYTWGTVWLNAFEVAHAMEPPPDLILFMADGTGGNSPPPILASNKKAGDPVVNTFAMQTSKGAREFQEIAKQAGGEFRIILSATETISGEDYFKDPSKYNLR